jgi:hypothetical protein
MRTPNPGGIQNDPEPAKLPQIVLDEYETVQRVKSAPQAPQQAVNGHKPK